MVESRYEFGELQHITVLWNEKLRKSLEEVPDEWMQKAFNRAAGLK